MDSEDRILNIFHLHNFKEIKRSNLESPNLDMNANFSDAVRIYQKTQTVDDFFSS
jgi:hypothetical protein